MMKILPNEMGFCSDRDDLLDDVPSKKLLIAVLMQAYYDLEALTKQERVNDSKSLRETLEFWESEVWEGVLRRCDLDDYIPKIRSRIEEVMGGISVIKHSGCR